MEDAKTLVFRKPPKPPKRGKQGKKEPALSLDPARMQEYKSMIEMNFRAYGPSKSSITLRAKEDYGYPVTAGINPDNWDAEFVVREGLEFRPSPALLRYLDSRNIVDPVGEMLHGVSSHEIGHWEFPRGKGFGCPYDKPTYYTSFIEPVYEELVRSGKFSPDQAKALSERISNAVSDVIDNYNVATTLIGREPPRPYAGQVLFWYLQGQERGSYSEEYSLFVKTNLALIGNKDDYRLLGRFMKESKELGQSVKNLARLFTPDMMLNKDDWERLARAYAREAIKFMDKDEEPQHQYSPGDRSAGPMQGSDGGQEGGGGKGGSKGEGKDRPGDHAAPGSKPSGSSGTGDRKPGTGNSKQPGDDLDEGDIEKIMMGRKMGQGIPFYIKPEKALDRWYGGLARRIRIKSNAGKLPAAKFPLIPLMREPFDSERHSPEDVLSGKVYLDPASRRIVPSVARTRLTVDVPLRKDKRNLPDFMFTLIDSSGSMMGQGNKVIAPWGDQSYYHYALLTFYGLLRFFESERLLHKLKVSGAIFSDITLSAKGLEEVKKLLLNPASGGTSIDLRKVMEVVSRTEKSMFSMISDGEIGNWAHVRDEFIELAKRHRFFMIQIGQESTTSADLRRAGLVVKRVTTHGEIVKLAIDLTAEGYRDAISKGLQSESRKYRNW